MIDIADLINPPAIRDLPALDLDIVDKELMHDLRILRIKKEVYAEMREAVKNSKDEDEVPIEVLGFMFGSEPNLVDAIYIPPEKYQQRTKHEVSISAENLLKSYKEEEYKKKYFNSKYSVGWFHSHASHDIGYSPTDQETHMRILQAGMRDISRGAYVKWEPLNSIGPIIDSDLEISKEFNKIILTSKKTGNELELTLEPIVARTTFELFNQDSAIIKMKYTPTTNMLLCYGLTLSYKYKENMHPELWIQAKMSSIHKDERYIRLNKHTPELKIEVEIV